MAGLKELLVKTAGLTALGRAYADGIQTGAIDGDDFGIALVDLTIKGSKTRSGHIEVTLCTKSEDITLSGNDVRGVFAVLYGALAAEFDEAIDTGTDKPNPAAADLVVALDLLRTAQGVMGEPSEIEGSQEWFEAADKLLAKYPAAALAKA